MKWILILLVVLISGCVSSQSLKVVADVNSSGDVTYHTEYNVEF